MRLSKKRFILGIIVIVGFILGIAYPAKAAGNSRIHIMTFSGSDAIILESDGHFGMVDSGEDSDYPDGSDPRYPLRTGIVRSGGTEDIVIDYMKSIGVTKDNFEFYIGTHPHSDHIGSADEIIREFCPERVYIMEYSEEYITSEEGLFDNLYVYDRMLEAAREVGAVIIQNFSTDAPVVPEQTYSNIPEPVSPEENQKEDSRIVFEMEREEILDTYGIQPAETDELKNPEELPKEGVNVIADTAPNSVALSAPASTTGNPNFKLGDMSVEIMNYSDDYKTYPKPDANYFSLGVKVTVNGKSAFLAGDIGAYDGDEARLASAIGKVDVLKLGHHGYSSSNTGAYLKALSPQIAVQTGKYYYLAAGTVQSLDEIGTRLYSVDSCNGEQAVILDFSGERVGTNVDGSSSFVSRTESPHLTYYVNGRKERYDGFAEYNDLKYYFDNDCYATEAQWVEVGDKEYYMKDDGTLAADQWIGDRYVDSKGMWIPGAKKEKPGWKYNSGQWYYLDSMGNKVTGWKFIDGSWYYMDSSGAMLASQWLWSSGKCYYLSESGRMLTDQWISGSYVDESGAWVPDKQLQDAGWKYESGKWYYIEKDGNKAFGWRLIEGKWYYFDDSKVMVTGWKYISGVWYYMDSSGAMLASQWLWSSGNCYYLSADGKMLTKQWISGYYVDNTGAWIQGLKEDHVGWQHIGQKWYYMNSSRVLVTGWLYVDQNWYYMNSSGVMLTGWQRIDQKRYYLDPWGAMITGWRYIDQKWYYMNSSGEMITGWQKVGSIWYYMEDDGHMLTSQWIDEDNYVNSSGEWVPDYASPDCGWKQSGENTYYYNKQGKMVTGWKNIDGEWYYFYYTGIMAAEKWFWYDYKCYYFDISGKMVTDQWVLYEEKYYYLSTDGHMLTDTWIGDVYVDETGAAVKGVELLDKIEE